MSVTNETTQSPPTTVTITPVGLSTVDVQNPEPILAACAREGIAKSVTSTAPKALATTNAAASVNLAAP